MKKVCVALLSWGSLFVGVYGMDCNLDVLAMFVQDTSEIGHPVFVHPEVEDSVSEVVQDILPLNDDLFRYKLYPTENMWNFIKLDTRTGRMWMVQFTVDGDESHRFESVLSYRDLAIPYDDDWNLLPEEGKITNRFELYPTENMYNFILLDRIGGRTYQVQWNFDYEKRLVIPIY